MRVGIRAITVVIGAGLLVAGCGGTSGGQSGTPAQGASTAAATSSAGFDSTSDPHYPRSPGESKFTDSQGNTCWSGQEKLGADGWACPTRPGSRTPGTTQGDPSDQLTTYLENQPGSKVVAAPGGNGGELATSAGRIYSVRVVTDTAIIVVDTFNYGADLPAMCSLILGSGIVEHAKFYIAFSNSDQEAGECP